MMPQTQHQPIHPILLDKLDNFCKLGLEIIQGRAFPIELPQHVWKQVKQARL